ncbi:hypothetical protein Q3G72_017704 [Acer saccharum]|nr:hypothetical protein Q3G72_017704 [Acer saccharum]
MGYGLWTGLRSLEYRVQIKEWKKIMKLRNLSILNSMDEKFSNGVDMDLDDIDFSDSSSIHELGEDFLQNFCKKAAMAFFNEYGLISHQINSYNDFIKNGLQKVFDSFGETIVEPAYGPKKGDEWQRASVRFGQVTLDKPSFWSGSEGREERTLLPRHARLQNMTYSARMKVNVKLEIYTQQLVKSDKFKTGKEKFIDKDVKHVDEKDIIIGRIPVMVKSDICWMKGSEKDDCDFDQGGYFLIKGAEKIFIAQEQICMKRLWVSNNQGWTVAYKSEMKRNRLIIRLEGMSKDEDIKGVEKALVVYFLSTKIPLWILFFALGVSSDKEVVNLIDYSGDNASILNILIATIHDADDQCKGFRKEKTALSHVNKLIKATQFPPEESIDKCISMYLFPSLDSSKKKARFLGYMVKCLLQAYTGHRKCENRDNFRNKRLELASELLERELKVHIAHARRRMAKTLQRDLREDRAVRQIDYYLDASIVTNGLSRAFSTGAWSHPYKRMERISGVVANLGRANPLQTMVDLRRARQQVQYTGKVGDARYPHPSHWDSLSFVVELRDKRRRKELPHQVEIKRDEQEGEGIVPDVVINPHAFPSRQTPAQLLEAALGKGIACGGLKKYATPFSTPSFDAITEQLHRAGFSKSGMERVYNGRTDHDSRWDFQDLGMIYSSTEKTLAQEFYHNSEREVISSSPYFIQLKLVQCPESGHGWTMVTRQVTYS